MGFFRLLFGRVENGRGKRGFGQSFGLDVMNELILILLKVIKLNETYLVQVENDLLRPCVVCSISDLPMVLVRYFYRSKDLSSETKTPQSNFYVYGSFHYDYIHESLFKDIVSLNLVILLIDLVYNRVIF